MITLNDVNRKLRKGNRHNYVLYLVCNFVSLTLITAYSAMMFSPTVMNILPEGGDSRRQMMSIFVLACVGCVVFSIYAASLFFRMKSKELGTMMALGATKKRLAPALFHEVVSLSGGAALLGTVCGIPFAWLIWRGFRLFVVDSPEMILRFNLKCLGASAVFIMLVILSAFILGLRYLNRTNIMDVVHEEHKNEPVHEVKRWCGPVGIVVLLVGAVMGYSSSGLCQKLFDMYAPAWLNLLYAPVFIGLYMILLHTVIHGWKRNRKNPYQGIISRSMMKFQGKQTVNNMLVVTVLIAGACFGMFYTPILGTAQSIATKNRQFDYAFNYRLDQNVPGQDAIRKLADDYGLLLKDWRSKEYITLAMDGKKRVDDAGGKFHDEYRELLTEGKFISETAFQVMTGLHADVPRGGYCPVVDQNEAITYWVSNDCQLFTNMISGAELPITFSGYLHYDLMMDEVGYYVLDDADYKNIAVGLTPDWMGKLVYFNINGEDSYTFADKLYNVFVDSFEPECLSLVHSDRVEKATAERYGEVYEEYTDSDNEISIGPDQRDSSEFRMYWNYMPKFRILDQNDFLRSFAVFVMMFIFIAIVCMMAALIICNSRCLTLTVNNRYVFDDLKRLGASPAFLHKEVRSQSTKVFSVPTIVGMGVMYLLYCMIMYANDGKVTDTEFVGLAVCFGLLVILAGVVWLVWRRTFTKMLRVLNIP